MWANLPVEIHEYFFRRLLAGEHRAKQELTKQFYVALYDECRRRGLRAAWSSENTQVIQEMMANLNFNEPDRARHTPPAATKH